MRDSFILSPEVVRPAAAELALCTSRVALAPSSGGCSARRAPRCTGAAAPSPPHITLAPAWGGATDSTRKPLHGFDPAALQVAWPVVVCSTPAARVTTGHHTGAYPSFHSTINLLKRTRKIMPSKNADSGSGFAMCHNGMKHACW